MGFHPVIHEQLPKGCIWLIARGFRGTDIHTRQYKDFDLVENPQPSVHWV